MTTREAIVSKALQLFNEKGIEYTGMREIAGELQIRVSNITYYFPTKDDLVMELATNLQELNSNTIAGIPHESIRDLIFLYTQIFHNQYQYRCLLLSFVHLITQNPVMKKTYKATEEKRRKFISQFIGKLVASGYLKEEIKGQPTELLVSNIALLSRFWISESRVSYPDHKPEATIRHYIRLLENLLHQCATAKGKKELAV
jgi:AcrR family transcriptional regulator